MADSNVGKNPGNNAPTGPTPGGPGFDEAYGPLPMSNRSPPTKWEDEEVSPEGEGSGEGQ